MQLALSSPYTTRSCHHYKSALVDNMSLTHLKGHSHSGYHRSDSRGERVRGAPRGGRGNHQSASIQHTTVQPTPWPINGSGYGHGNTNRQKVPFSPPRPNVSAFSPVLPRGAGRVGP